MAHSPHTPLDAAFDKVLQLSFPPVLVQLLQALLEPTPSFASISSYLSMDPMLAGRVLHIVNSSSYGFRNKVTDLQRAAIAIGTSELFKLVISLSLQQTLNPVVQRDPDLVFSDWRLTLWSALSAEAIARQLVPERAQEAYLAGMLKDIPLYLAFCQPQSDFNGHASRLATLPWLGRMSDELATWGRTHEEMAKDIFLYWQFPEDLAEAVSKHHEYNMIAFQEPLAKSLILATRWSELLHAPGADPSSLVSFELNLAAELGFDMQRMEAFRAQCAESFTQLLGQLGIQQAKPETRLHSRSLGDIQSYYFLALGVVSERHLLTPASFALALEKQLRLFWGISEWKLAIRLPPEENMHAFTCSASEITDAGTEQGVPDPSDSLVIHIVSGEAHFGFICLPRDSSMHSDIGTLPLFVHMLGMHLAAFEREIQAFSTKERFDTLPLALAHLNSKGEIHRATTHFCESLNLQDTPVGLSGAALIKERLGLAVPKTADEEGAAGSATGHVACLPDARSPGMPVFVALCPSLENPQESYLLLSDIATMTPMQVLAVSRAGLLESLFTALHASVCLIDGTGGITWADATLASLVGKNIFTLFSPAEAVPGNEWGAPLLAGIQKSAEIQVHIPAKPHLRTYTLLITARDAESGTHTLLLVRPSQK